MPQPPVSGCRIFEGPQLIGNGSQLTFLNKLALPHTFQSMWENFFSLNFITKCLKSPSKLKGASLRQSNFGKLQYGFVSACFLYFSPCKFPVSSRSVIQSNFGECRISHYPHSTFLCCSRSQIESNKFRILIVFHSKKYVIMSNFMNGTKVSFQLSSSSPPSSFIFIILLFIQN